MKKAKPKILIKKELPEWVMYVVLGLAWIEILMWWAGVTSVKELMTPIVMPHAVYRKVPPEYMNAYEGLKECQHDWKEDEALIRRLRRRMEP